MVTASRAWLEAPRQLRFQEISLDRQSLDATALYAETEYSGISLGTESAAYAGKAPLRPGPVYPRLLGYSNVAKVLQVGTAVCDVAIGDRIFTHQSHQSAFVCDQQDVLAHIPEAVPSDVASLTYLAHIALACLQRTELRAGEVTAVIGLGVIGLSAVALAKHLGAYVIALGNDSGRLQKARDLGADLCLDSADGAIAEQIKQAIGRSDVDLVVSTVNSWSAWLSSLRLLRYAGRIGVLGFPGRDEAAPSFNPLAMELTYLNQLRIFHCGLARRGIGEQYPLDVRHNMARLLESIAAGTLPLPALLTHCVPWHALESVYRRSMQHDKSLVGAVLQWQP